MQGMRLVTGDDATLALHHQYVAERAAVYPQWHDASNKAELSFGPRF
jgi:hypothetical protein